MRVFSDGDTFVSTPGGLRILDKLVRLLSYHRPQAKTNELMGFYFYQVHAYLGDHWKLGAAAQAEARHYRPETDIPSSYALSVVSAPIIEFFVFLLQQVFPFLQGLLR